MQVDSVYFQWQGPALSQHVADTFTPLLPFLPVLHHLAAKVLTIEHKSVKQVPRRDINPTFDTCVSPYAQLNRAMARWTPLEDDRWIKLRSA